MVKKMASHTKSRTQKKRKIEEKIVRKMLLENRDCQIIGPDGYDMTSLQGVKKTCILWLQRTVFFALTHNDSFDNKSQIMCQSENESEEKSVIMTFCSKSPHNDGDLHDKVTLRYSGGQYIWTFESDRWIFPGKTIRYMDDHFLYLVLKSAAKFTLPSVSLSQIQCIEAKFIKATGFDPLDHLHVLQSVSWSQTLLTQYEALIYSMFVDEHPWVPDPENQIVFWKEVRFGPNETDCQKIRYSEAGDFDILGWSFFAPVRACVEKFVKWRPKDQVNPYVIKVQA
jgi:hypothetical protein